MPVYDLGVELYIRDIMSLPDIQSRIQRLMIESIESSRNDHSAANLDVTKRVSDILVSLTSSAAALQQKTQQIQKKDVKVQNFYESIFENNFLQMSSQYYRKLSQQWMLSKTTPEYLESVDSAATFETSLCMSQQTLPKLESVLFSEFIGRDTVASTLINNPENGLSALMAGKKYPELGLMRRLFDRVPAAHELMCNAVKGYIAAMGARVTSSLPAYDVYTNELLCMQQQARKFLGASFGEDIDFAQAINNGFEIFMNEYTDTPVFLARFMHEMLAKNARAVGNGEEEEEEKEGIDSIASEIVALFRHIHDKDRFEACYRKHLAARLLTGRSASIAAERRILALFRAECGSQYTSKADGMFHDMQFSEDITSEFQAKCVCPVKMNVSVLSSHLWSLKVPAECTLPSVVTDSCRLFEEYFTKKYDSRKFTWLHGLGIADVKVAITPTKVYSFLLSAHQLAILGSIFADDTSADVGLTVDKLADITKLPRADIRRCLSLFCRTRLITCWVNDENAELNPKQLTPAFRINDSLDRFYVNKRFAYKSHRVNLATLKDNANSSLSLSSSSQSNQSLSSSLSSSSSVRSESGTGGDSDNVGDADMGGDDKVIEEDRKFVVDSAIVRIMKMNKTMKHGKLISEVTGMVKIKFVPSPQLLKNRIEHLIESEFVNNISINLLTYL